MVPLLGRTVRSVARVIQGRRSPEKLVGAIPLSAPSTPWTASVTGHRSTAFSRVPLSELKRIKNTFGCTLNDVVLALVSGTLREYLDEKGALPDDSLLAICPISVRNDESASSEPSANRVSGMFVSLGSNIDEIPDRIAHIRSSTKGAKEEHNAVGATMLMDWAEYASPNVFNMASRLYSNMGLASRHRAIHNVIISNVPGPNFPLYFAGAELVAAYPLGPVMEGCGLNITVFSYRDSVDIGFMACRELIPDVWDLAEATNRAMRDLSEAADREAARAERMLPRAEGGDTTSTEAAATPAPTRAKAPAPTKAAAKRTPAKKAPAKRTPAKKAPAKRSAAKKAPAKSTAAKKPSAKKATAKASQARRSSPRSRAS
jgi:WS/DGAT/MGAT family acyltransferase